MEARLTNPTAIPKSPAVKTRIESIDLLRGVVIVIMALDHVRDYFHAAHFLFDPTDINQTSPGLFFTRWITHFCAPAFMFLAGTSAFFVGERKSKGQLTKFLLTRGLWLMLLEITVVNFAWFFNPDFPFFRLSVIWALGASMIALSLLIYLPKKLLLAFGLIILFGHNLLDNIHVAGTGVKAFLWAELHEQKQFDFYGRTIRTGYPLLPWIGIMTLGYCFGNLYRREVLPARRKRFCLLIGAGAIILFIVLRATNVYGDPHRWSAFPTIVRSVMSFFNVTKYPPSLLFTLMTLGPCLIFLALAEKPLQKFGTAITHIGRVPMFFYILHIYLIHALALIAVEISGRNWTQMILFGNANPHLKGYGFSLWVVYVVWVLVIIALYPLCKWYDRYKTTHKEKWWLSYL